MDHDRASELLGAYVLYSCGDDETAAIKLHVGSCAECTDEIERLGGVAGLIGATDLVSPPAYLRDAVLNAARNTAQEPSL